MRLAVPLICLCATPTACGGSAQSAPSDLQEEEADAAPNSGFDGEMTSNKLQKRLDELERQIEEPRP